MRETARTKPVGCILDGSPEPKMEILARNSSSRLDRTVGSLARASSRTLELPNSREAALCAAVGGIGAVLFLFAFPAGAISTLMHAVLHLPGPGAGIVLVVGPFLVLVGLGCSLLTRAKGGALIAAVAFGLSCTLIVKLLGVATDPKGAFGSLPFLAALGLLGLAIEAVMAAGRPKRYAWRCVLAGMVANAVLLVFYWVAIFPRTAGWVKWQDIPPLAGVCLAAGLVSGYITGMLSRALCRILATEQKE